MAESRVVAINAALRGAIDNTVPLLRFEGPFELLIAVILSAQTTDRQVNSVTP